VSLSISTWRKQLRPACAFAAALLLIAMAARPCLAQATQSADSISTRIQRLEAKVQSLQVTIGTLQSLSAARPAAQLPPDAPSPLAPPQSGSADLGPRIAALETQIAALASHIEQIGKQMSAIEAKLAGADAPIALAPPSVAAPPVSEDESSRSALEPFFSSSEESRDVSKERAYGANPDADAVAKLLEDQAAREQAGAHGNAVPGAPQSLAPALPSAEAETLYREGHAALIQKDYARAEAAFGQLIAASPNDPLASRSQYWIGEAHYAQNQYKSAADALLKAYKADEAGEKAPYALLKLGMALAGLGQKEAACSTFQELKTKFPKAPAPLPKEAETWRKKTGC
jgi:tol-pal system protein YbgF